MQNDIEAALFETQLPTIVALIKGCKSAKVVRSLNEIPEGCGASVVTSTITVHTLVRGLVDLDVEIAKCDKKLDLAKLNLAKIVKVESQADYAETVPENVRLANEDKVRCCLVVRGWELRLMGVYLDIIQRKTIEAEIATLELSREMFSKLK